MSGRRDMIERVRKALGRARDAPVAQAPRVDEQVARLVAASDDLPALFARRAEAVGMEVVRCDEAGLAAAVARTLGQAGARRVACSVEALATAVAAAGCEPVDWRGDDGADEIYEADAGLSEAAAAVAETGSILCAAGVGEARGISLAPRLHLAIVRKRVIVADILDCVRLGWAAAPPSALAMVTGPSKTADIEGVLVRGVHGPGRVVIFMVGHDRPADQ